MRGELSESREKQLGKQLAGLFNKYDGPGFSIRLWNGWQWNCAQDGTACTLAINSPDALASMAGGAGEVALGGAFIRKEVDVEGDLFSAFSVAEYLMARPRALRQRATETVLANALNLRRWMNHGAKHSRKRDLASISYHYDLPVEFYRPWLGETLAYSCAYFHKADDSLDQAQEQKLDLICRKLRLKEHERFLDIGCGWGSLVLRAACRHGARAHGITLSREQAAVANQRIRCAGLTDSCMVEHRDYRNCAELFGLFDKIASIGMFEHVGLPNLPIYFATVRRLLKPGGTFLNHGIARSQSAPSPRNSFVDRYVFPDGKLVTLTEAINAAEGAGFEVRDVENLREHYELTLRHWVDSLRRNKDTLLEIVPETTYRIWLLYTAGSAAAFRSGRIAIHQVLFSRLDRGRSRLPLVRDDWYANGEAEEGLASETAGHLESL
jgi:cyclopropane-fatty-acyl-phospholipid synthase